MKPIIHKRRRASQGAGNLSVRGTKQKGEKDPRIDAHKLTRPVVKFKNMFGETAAAVLTEIALKARFSGHRKLCTALVDASLDTKTRFRRS